MRLCGINQGECRGGTQVCGDGVWGACSVPPEQQVGTPELCDGKDNDCDGETDEPLDDEEIPVCGADCPDWRTTPVEVAPADHLHWSDEAVVFCVDRWEASHTAPDEPDDAAASVVRGIPWTNVSFPEAVAACERAGKSLCPAAVFQAACGQVGLGTFYPYASPQGGAGTYSAGICNGDHFRDGFLRTGEASQCRILAAPGRGQGSVDSIYDLSGNVAEWVAPPVDEPLVMWSAGGAWDSSPEDLTCSSFVGSLDGAPAPHIGFRCCTEVVVP